MYAALPLRLHSLTIAFLLVSTLSACLSADAPEPPSVRLSGRIAYGTESGIWIMNADGSGRLQVTHPDSTMFDYDPVWSPDGKQIAFRREPKNESKPDDNFGVMVVNVDGSGLFKLTQRYGVQAIAGTPSWSAEGFKIAVTCNCPDGEGIYVGLSLRQAEMPECAGCVVQRVGNPAIDQF